jgi:hypothetical protein
MLEAGRLVKLGTYRGKSGMTTLLPRLAGDDAGLVSIYCDNGSAYLQFWRSVFERRAPGSIPVVEAAAKTEIKQGNTTHDISEQLLEALTQAYQEAAAMTSLIAPSPAGGEAAPSSATAVLQSAGGTRGARTGRMDRR